MDGSSTQTSDPRAGLSREMDVMTERAQEALRPVRPSGQLSAVMPINCNRKMQQSNKI